MILTRTDDGFSVVFAHEEEHDLIPLRIDALVGITINAKSLLVIGLEVNSFMWAMKHQHGIEPDISGLPGNARYFTREGVLAINLAARPGEPPVRDVLIDGCDVLVTQHMELAGIRVGCPSYLKLATG